MGRDPLEVQKCLKNKGKTRGTKSLVTEVNNCPGFARSSLNIIVNCTSSLDMGEKKVEDFPPKPNLHRWQQSFLRRRNKSEMNVDVEEVGVPGREFSVPPLLR